MELDFRPRRLQTPEPANFITYYTGESFSTEGKPKGHGLGYDILTLQLQYW